MPQKENIFILKWPNDLKHSTDLLQLMSVMKMTFLVTFDEIRKTIFSLQNITIIHKRVLFVAIIYVIRAAVNWKDPRLYFTCRFYKSSLEHDFPWNIYAGIVGKQLKILEKCCFWVIYTANFHAKSKMTGNLVGWL